MASYCCDIPKEKGFYVVRVSVSAQEACISYTLTAEDIISCRDVQERSVDTPR